MYNLYDNYQMTHFFWDNEMIKYIVIIKSINMVALKKRHLNIKCGFYNKYTQIKIILKNT